MKLNQRIALTCVLAASVALSHAQSVPDYAPFFSAIVVSDVEQSSVWYKNVFGLTVKEKMNDPNNVYKIVIMESANRSMQLELLELKGSLSRKLLTDGKPSGTEIQGHFKIGFKVADIDQWLKHLSQLKITVSQVWTNESTKKRNFTVSDPDGNLIQFFD